MSTRAALAMTGGLAVLAAVALALWSTPDTGVPLGAAIPAPTPTQRPARPAVPSPQAASRDDDEVPEQPEREDGGPDEPAPEAVVHDLNKLYDDRTGPAEALVARMVPLAACWTAFEQRAPVPPSGRFSVELVVEGDGNSSTVEANVANEDVDDALQTCVSSVMADARFGPVVGIHRWMMPVPIPQ